MTTRPRAPLREALSGSLIELVESLESADVVVVPAFADVAPAVAAAEVTAEPEAVGILRTSVSEDAAPEPVAEATAELGGTVSVSEETAAPTSAQESSYAMRGSGALGSDRAGR